MGLLFFLTAVTMVLSRMVILLRDLHYRLEGHCKESDFLCQGDKHQMTLIQGHSCDEGALSRV